MLATIQKIDNLTPIPNADFIEVAHVLGWLCVVKKGEFKIGDPCIYIEIDSLIPRKKWSEFLFPNPPKYTEVLYTTEQGDEFVKLINVEYHRLRTVKLKGQISQGLALPLESAIFIKDNKKRYWIGDNDCFIESYGKWLEIGDDVTEYLEIKKYEKSTTHFNPRTGMQAKGNFPGFLHKTDEVRIQSVPELIEKLKGKEHYITVKLDGTSATYYRYKGKFGVCSRNIELKNLSEKTLKERIQYLFNKLFKRKFRDGSKKFDLDIYWKMAYKYKIMDWLPDGYAIQGEICGPRIQDNKLDLKDHELFIFNVFYIPDQEYLFPSCGSLCIFEENCPIQFVPFITIYDNVIYIYGREFNYTMEELLKMANDLNYDNGTPAEGIVVRSLDQTISFKVVSNRFLLKYGE